MGTIVNFATNNTGNSGAGYNEALPTSTGIKVAAGAAVDSTDSIIADIYFEVIATIPSTTNNSNADDGSGFPTLVQQRLVNGYTDAAPPQMVIGGLTEGDSVDVLLYAYHGFNNPSTVTVTSGTSFSGSFTSTGTYAARTETGTVTVNAAGTITIDLGSATGGALNLIQIDITPAALSLTAPDTVTHGVATTATGNLLSTVNVTTGMTLEYGTVAIAQTATFVDPDLNFTPDVGVPTAYGPGNAVDSLPLTPDSASAGTTPYQVTLEVTDG
tara:strand:+ start:1048 stop:1860 length:813 start_codon:yes stop_codon:yes gene_type:complete